MAAAAVAAVAVAEAVRGPAHALARSLGVAACTALPESVSAATPVWALGRGCRLLTATTSTSIAIKHVEWCKAVSLRLPFRTLRENRVMRRSRLIMHSDNLSDHLLAGAGRVEDDIAASRHGSVVAVVSASQRVQASVERLRRSMVPPLSA